MNNLKFTEWLFSPFKFVAGTKALLIGLIVMGVISFLGYAGNTHFDGVFDIHFGPSDASTTFILHAFYQISSWIILTVLFYVASIIITKSKVRLIDIAGTMAFAKTPFIIAALFGLIPSTHLPLGGLNPNNVSVGEMASLVTDNMGILLTSLAISVIVIVWHIRLAYNAYSISANVKGAKAIVTFIVVLVICEILSKVAIHLIAPLL